MSKITPFVIGGLLGAGIAMLYAPKTGEQTRALVAEKANALWGEAQDFGAGFPGSLQDAAKAAADMGASFVKDAQSKTTDLVGEASNRVKGATGQATGADTDELREKIEAARKRIAAQVMENAEQSKAVEVTADAAEKAAE